MLKQTLKIALVAPAFGSTGGPEVVVQNLVNALVEKGVDVTLFAPGDWKTKAKHISTIPQSLWNMKDFKEQTEYERKNLIITSQLHVLKYQKEFDLIHLHSQRYAYAVSGLSEKPCLLTIHSNITGRDFNQIKAGGIYTAVLSELQKKELGASADILNGVETEKINFSPVAEDYLITIGRITEPKGIDTAIEIAKKAGKKLLIFGRVGNSPERQAYFNNKIHPELNDTIIYMGETSQKDLFGYLRKAEALLFPIKPRKGDCLRVVPLVVMESLACGTPVIGVPMASSAKNLFHPSISCLSNDFETLVAAAGSTEKFNRKKCRETAEKYFDSKIMADNYIALYEKILKKSNS